MSIIDDVKSVAKTAQQIGNIELYSKIIDLQGKILEVYENNIKLQEENNNLKKQLEDKGKVFLRDEAYYNESGGPYCTKCWEVDRKLVSVTGHRLCPNCKMKIKASIRGSDSSLLL